MQKYLVVFILILLSSELCAQEHYVFVTKNVSYLLQQMGEPNTISRGATTAYKYTNGDENTVFGIGKSGKVYVAIKRIKVYSLSKAKSTSSSQILYYLALGFNKQGSEAGLTILKKGSHVISVGYTVTPGDKYGEIYSVLVTAH